MSKQKQHWENATVLATHPGPTFRVKVETGPFAGQEALTTLCGKMYRNHIHVIPGDRVGIVLSTDGARGRIEQRFRT